VTRRAARADDEGVLELLRIALRPPPAAPTRRELDRLRRAVQEARPRPHRKEGS